MLLYPVLLEFQRYLIYLYKGKKEEEISENIKFIATCVHIFIWIFVGYKTY